MDTEKMIWIDARDKPGLLLAMMKAFVSQSHISFEGYLGNLAFCKGPNVSMEETDVLKRQTISPRMDFVVITLTEKAVHDIWKELSEKDHLVHEGIIHVQIESNGKLMFGGYDNFHRDCTVAYPGVSITLLDKLKERGVIREFNISA